LIVRVVAGGIVVSAAVVSVGEGDSEAVVAATETAERNTIH